MKKIKREVIELIQKVLFKMFLKKIPKENFGRCISCHANTICHKQQYTCKATMEQQYKLKGVMSFLTK